MTATVNNEKTPIKPSFGIVKILITVLVVTLVVAGGYLHFHKNNTASSGVDQSGKNYSQPLGQLQDVSLKAPSGAGMNFKKPASYETFKTPYQTASMAQYKRNFQVSGKPIVTGTMSAVITQSDSASTANTAQILSSGNVDSKSNGVNTTLESLSKNTLGNNYKLNFSKPKTATTADIKSNAWQIDYTANPNNSNNNLPKLQGSALVVVGKNNIYYLMADATQYDWQSNQTIWKSVFDSLKVNE
jgi:hypothetical protein